MIEKIIKLLIKRTSYYNRLLNYDKLEEYWKWLYSGKPVPPPDIVKQMTVKEYANRYNIKIMVETGTYRGDMIFAVEDIFDKMYSIELDDMLYMDATKRFEKYRNIKIIKGDSSEVLPNVLENINESCLFWLDGHYMPSIGTKGEKETPIIEEIEHISSHPIKNHVLLVDDARHFIGKDSYPSMKEFRDIVSVRFPKHSFTVENDMVRITPSHPY